MENISPADIARENAELDKMEERLVERASTPFRMSKYGPGGPLGGIAPSPLGQPRSFADQQVTHWVNGPRLKK